MASFNAYMLDFVKQEEHMADKLVVAVLGNRNAGKSETWYGLFKAKVKTGKSTRPLYLTGSHYIENVFLLNGSPEERNESVDSLIGDQQPTVVLCSTQYTEDNQTLQYFIDNGYDLYVQWLNPGYYDQQPYDDELGFVDHLLSEGATVTMRSGQLPLEERVKEIRQFIFGWAFERNLINPNF
jgi:hypothetical protein